MKKVIERQTRREKRRVRVRARIFGTATCPRLNVFRSLKSIYAQLIADEQGKTLVAVHSKALKIGKIENYAGKAALAYAVGKELAVKAKEKNITAVVFDRAGYRYQGRVKALAEGARAGGLVF